MEENGLSQISLTVPEARLNYQVTNHPTDQGLLESTLRGIKDEYLEGNNRGNDR